MDALEGLAHHRLDAEQVDALAAQSRELPVPYSLPAIRICGVCSFL